MYKVILNNQVIDLLTKKVYIRYLAGVDRTVETDPTSANAILSDNGDKYYCEAGMTVVDELPAQEVVIEEIGEDEYNTLKMRLASGEEISGEVTEESTDEKIARLEKLVAVLLEENARLR